MKRSRKWMCVWIALLILITISAVLMRYRSVSFPVPDQNAYPDLLRAAALTSSGNFDYDYSNQQALERFVSQNREAYAIVTSVLDRNCKVAIEVSQEWSTRHQSDVSRLKRLTHAMVGRAKLAELEGQTEAAFEAYMEAYRFADAIGRGGLSLDYLNGFSCRVLVLRDCQSLFPSLSTEQRAEFLSLIQRSAAEQESPADVVKRTHQWGRAIFGFRGELEQWRRRLGQAWEFRTLRPFASQQSLLARGSCPTSNGMRKWFAISFAIRTT